MKIFTKGITGFAIFLAGIFQGSFAQTGVARPQTPKPPFPYRTDSLIYYSKPDSLKYGASLTIPQGEGPFPAIILISGSGAQDRDETLLGHKPFAVLADFLTRLGFLVMRVDDRGIGASGGNFSASTTLDFARDVQSHVDFLKARKEVNPGKIGLMGHSEGGLIAPIVASQRKDISFIVMLAGPGIPIAKLMAEQNEAILKSSTIDSVAAQSYTGFFGRTMPRVAAAKDAALAREILIHDLKAWQAAENPNRVVATTRIHDEKSFDFYVSQVIKQIYTPWFRNFLLTNPQDYLKKLRCKVLALNGSRDIQVVAASNLDGIRMSLAASSSPAYSVEEMAGLNHLFQSCKSCTVMEYGTLTETMSPMALQRIGDWLTTEILHP